MDAARESAKSTGGSRGAHKVGAALLLLLMALAIGYLTYTVLFHKSPTTSEQRLAGQSRVEVHVVTPQASLQQPTGEQQPRLEPPDPQPQPVAPSEPQQPPEQPPVTAPPPEPAPPAVVVEAAVEPESWRNFKQTFGRVYASAEEEAQRRLVFEANLRFIETHNAQPNQSFRLAVNHLAELTRDEINDMYVGPTMSWAQTSAQLAAPILPPMKILSDGEQPVSLDWRNLTTEPGAAFPCRASAVFAAVANVEAALSAQLGGQSAVKLSEGQVLNCLASVAPPNSPPVCAGFISMLHVFELLRHLDGGLASASAFAQLSAVLPPNMNACRVPPGDQVRARLAGLAYVHRDNLLEALASGPLTVALDASQSSFHFYQSGLYQDPNCSPHQYNLHALLVGAAPDSLLLRTSLGADWGERGHLRLARRPDNRCLPQEMGVQPQLLPQAADH